MTNQWLIGLMIVVILAIIVDGIRRMRKVREDSLEMSLKPHQKNTVAPTLDYGNEFPNGGARPSKNEIDKNRIEQVRSQYNFGRDKAEILNRLAAQTRPDDLLDKQDKRLNNVQENEAHDTCPLEDEGDDSVNENFDTYEEGCSEAIVDPSTACVEKTEMQTTTQNIINNEQSSSEQPPNTQMLEDDIDPPVQQGILNLEDMLPVLMDALDEDNISESNTASRNEVDLNKTNNTISNQWYEDLSVRSVGQHIQPLIEPTIGDMDKGIAEFDFDAKETNTLPEENSTNHVDQLEIRLVNDPKDQSKPLSSDVKQQRRISSLSDVLVINVRSRKNKQIQGSDLLEQVLANGLQYGEMDIFHFHEGENSEAPVLFSMANMVKPGIFDLKTIDQLTTIGVTFFLTLPVPNDQAMIAYETMLSTAKNFSIALNAELNDDQHSVMTSQTIEHYRERILDFTRRQHLEKNK